MDRKSCEGHILLVDEEANSKRVLSAILTEEGYSVIESQNGEEALEIVQSEFNSIDVMVTDLKMSGKLDGMGLFRHMNAHYSDIPVIFLSSYGTVESAVHAIQSGAFYYLVKPPEYPKLKKIISRAVEQRELKREVISLKKELLSTRNGKEIVGKSKKMIEIYKYIKAIGKSQSNLLITGETGTGKELVAHALHHQRHGDDKPFVAVNCAAIPRELLEAELFGHEKGSFTGATSQRIGKVEEACGGSLFLDEIGELEPSLQAKLLRVLQEREIERLGSGKKIKVDFSLICATNTNLKKQIEKGLFRKDLYYRINVFNIDLPPLKERIDDIPLLVTRFLEEHCRKENKLVSIHEEALELLMRYHWPGNVRQLKNVIERAVVLTGNGKIQLKDLPGEIRQLRKSEPALTRLISLKQMEEQAVVQAMTYYSGNKSRVAKALGISRKALYKRLNDAQPVS